MLLGLNIGGERAGTETDDPTDHRAIVAATDQLCLVSFLPLVCWCCAFLFWCCQCCGKVALLAWACMFPKPPEPGSPDKKLPAISPNKATAGPVLTSVVDVEYIPLAVDLCHWVAEQTNSCIEIDQFISCLQDGIVLCRLLNEVNKLKCDKTGEPFKLVHFRENIGNSVFFKRINIETFCRWSKSFGVSDTCTVGDLVDLKDVMQAINHVYSVGRKCAELELPHPKSVALEIEHNMKYQDIIGLFAAHPGSLNKEEKAAKDGLINLMNSRGLGALRSDATLTEQLGNWKKRLVGKWAGTEIAPPVLEPIPPTPTPPPPPPPQIEPKMGPWDADEILFLIEVYKEQINEYGDDHIDFQLLSKNYSKRFKHRTPHQCWDKMYQLIERYQCDRSANRLFKRKVCSGPHHDQLHMCLGDTDLSKHLNAVYTGMVHPKAPAVPAYISCNSEQKTAEEQTGREQIAEQTGLLKEISNQLKEIREQTERNAATNSALLVLLTHVLKGGENAAENGQLFNGDRSVDCDSKSFGSDADLVEKSDDRRSL